MVLKYLQLLKMRKCGYKQQVPDFVVDEFTIVDGLEIGIMQKLQCVNCGGVFECVD